MSPTEPGHRRRDDGGDAEPPVRCEACRAALEAPGRDTISFLLVEGNTVPVVGCETHLERLRAACGFTTEGSVELLGHRPAGGVPCPGCRLAPHEPERMAFPVDDGLVAVVACPRHRTGLLERFRSGVRTRRQLAASLDTPQ